MWFKIIVCACVLLISQTCLTTSSDLNMFMYSTQQDALTGAEISCNDELLMTPQERPGVCHTAWRYVTYDCFEQKSDPAVCGYSGQYEQKNITPARCESTAFGFAGYRVQAQYFNEKMMVPVGICIRCVGNAGIFGSERWHDEDDHIFSHNSPWLSAMRECESYVANNALANLGQYSFGLCSSITTQEYAGDGDHGDNVVLLQDTSYYHQPFFNTQESLEHCGGGRTCQAPVVESTCRHANFGIFGFRPLQDPSRELVSVSQPRDAFQSHRFDPYEQAYKICQQRVADRLVERKFPTGSFAVCTDPHLREFQSKERAPKNFWWDTDFTVTYYMAIYNEGQSAKLCGTEPCTETWVDDTTKPIAATCRHSNFGRESSNVCSAAETIHYAATRSTVDALPAQDSWAWDGSIAKADCITDDLENTLDPAAKYARLQRNLDRLHQEDTQDLDKQALKTAVASRLKLLFELHGLELTAEQRDHAKTMYQTFDQAHLCGQKPSVADGEMQFYERLSLPHVAGALTRLYLDDAAMAVQTSGAQEHENILHRMTFHVVKNPTNNPHTPATDDQIDTCLEAIATWYDVAMIALQDKPATLWEKTGALLGELYARAYALPEYATTNAARLGAQTLVDSQTTAAHLITRAFTWQTSHGKSLHGAPLLYLLSDSLQGLMLRLEDSTMSHDMACRFASCKTDKFSNLLLPQLLDCMASLNPYAKNHDCVQTNIPKPWDSAFATLVMHRTRLQESLEQLQTLSVSDNPAPQASFLALTSTAGSRVDNYQATGLYHGEPTKVLHTGIKQSAWPTSLKELKERRDLLDRAVGEFERDRTHAVTAIYHEVKHQDNVALMRRNILEAAESLNQVHAEHSAAQQALAYAQRHDADAEVSLQKLASTSWAQSTFANASGPHQLSFKSNAGRFDVNSNHAPLDQLAALVNDVPWKLEAQAGDVIQIHVGDSQWSPTCALSKADLTTPKGSKPKGVDLSAAQIGPEGFIFTWSKDRYHVESIDTASEHSRANTSSKSHSACMVERMGYNVSGSGFGLEASSCIESRDSETESLRQAENTSTGNNFTQKMAFNQGLRLSNTPFPDMPAGSLLLVTMTPNATAQSDIQDIQVVTRNTSFVLPQDAHVYLVVNDLSDSTCKTRNGPLHLTVAHLRPQSNIMPNFAKAMGAAVAALHQEASPLIAQGFISPYELAAVRERTRQKMSAELNGALYVQDPLGGFFQAWLENELVVLDLQAHVARLDKELRLQRLRLHHLADGLKATEYEARLLQLLPVWSLGNLDINILRQKSTDLLQYLNRFIYPVVAVRYPGVFDQLSQDAEFMQLTHDLTNSPITEDKAGKDDAFLPKLSVRMVNRILNVVANATALSSVNQPGENLQIVTLSFPRPERTLADEYVWQQADMKRSTALWHALDTGTPAQLAIYPEDLYSADGLDTTFIPCNTAAPIIHSMSMYLEHAQQDADSLNKRTLSILLFADTLWFPGHQGPDIYTMAPGGWQTIKVPLIFGDLDKAVHEHRNNSTVFYAGNGLSPFATFSNQSLPRDIWKRAFKDARSLTLIFSVEGRELFGQENLSWIETCREATENNQ